MGGGGGEGGSGTQKDKQLFHPYLKSCKFTVLLNCYACTLVIVEISTRNLV